MDRCLVLLKGQKITAKRNETTKSYLLDFFNIKIFVERKEMLALIFFGLNETTAPLKEIRFSRCVRFFI